MGIPEAYKTMLVTGGRSCGKTAKMEAELWKNTAAPGSIALIIRADGTERVMRNVTPKEEENGKGST